MDALVIGTVVFALVASALSYYLTSRYNNVIGRGIELAVVELKKFVEEEDPHLHVTEDILEHIRALRACNRYLTEGRIELPPDAHLVVKASERISNCQGCRERIGVLHMDVPTPTLY